MNRSTLLILIVLVTAVLLLFARGTANTLAANPADDCTHSANGIVCTLADSAGIGAVQVREYTTQGLNLAVDNTYSSCPAEVDVSWMPLVPNYEMVVTDCGQIPQEEEIAYFAGLAHRSLGEAAAGLGQSSLAVTNFDQEGDDGVSIDLGVASLWSALLLPEAPAGDNAFEAAIFTLGARSPLAEIQFSKHMTDVIIYLPDGNHDVALYNGDRLVDSAADLPDGSSYVSLLTPFCEGIAERQTCVPRLSFGQEPAGLGFYWEISLPEPILLMVPSGQVKVDRLLFSTGDRAPLPVDIHSVQLTGSGLSRFTLFDESIQSPLPASTTFLPSIRGGGGPADPFGFDALTRFMESDPDEGQSLRISADLSVRVVGTGELIDEAVLEPEPGREPDDGSPDPDEPPASPSDLSLRVFNTTSQKEFEIEVSGPLLAQLGRLLPGTGAQPPGDPSLGVDGLLSRPGGIRGLSNGVDNRIHLTGTTWWPWRTIVHFSNNCSGTLIGPRHILTAAHCINKRGTNQWYSFTITPGRNGDEKPFGDATMSPNPQPGDPFRWYFTPSGWRDPQFNETNCAGSCFAASQWDWGLIIIPEYLGYQTGWMGFVARPASQLNYQAHFNRGYPACSTGKPNVPAGCDVGELYGDTQICGLGNYSYQGSDGWNRLIRNSCDISGGHSGSAVYHYFYDPYLGQSVPVVAMVEIWEHCYTCSAGDDTPNTARRLTPSSIDTILFFRQWKP